MGVYLDLELDRFTSELHNKCPKQKLVSKNVIKVEEIKNMASYALNLGPDLNGKAKLEQLLVL